MEVFSVRRAFATALVTPVLLTAFARVQDSPPVEGSDDETPLPPGIAARVDDFEITLDEYKDHLLKLYGSGPLDDLIYARLLEREAERLAVVVSEEELDAEDESFWNSFRIRFRGDDEALRRELAGAGFTEASYRAKVRADTRRNLVEGRVCVKTRAITDEGLRARFDLLHGKDGVKVEVRHLLLTPARTKAELRLAGVPDHELVPERLEAEMGAKAEEALARLRAGEEFVAVAKAVSHDVSVHQNEGVIPGYNYERYGPDFAAAVRQAAVGAVAGPVRTRSGLHVLEVTARVETKLADVREELTRILREEPATWQERNALRARLTSEAAIRKFR